MVSLLKQSSKLIEVADTNSQVHLWNMAWMSIFLQYWGAIIYLFCSLVIPDSHDIAVGCGVLAICISLTPVVYVFLHKQFLLLFSCIAAFNLAPIWFLYLEAVLPGYDAYVYTLPAFRMEAFFWIAVFQLSGNSLYIIFGKILKDFSKNSFSFLKFIKPKPEFYGKLTILVFFVPILLFYFYYGSAEIIWKAVTIGRASSEEGSGSVGLLVQSNIGGASSLMLPVNSVWQLTPFFSAIAFISAKSKHSLLAILSLVLGGLVIFVFFLTGTRGNMMFVAAPVLFFFFYYNWDRGLKFWLIAVTLIFAFIGIMDLQVRFRGNLLDVLIDPEKAAQTKGYDSATTFDPTKSQRDNNTYLFCLMLKGYPDKYAFEGYHDYFTNLVNPIPRFFWPNKPVLQGTKDLSKQLPFIYDGPIFMATTSLTYSIVGEAYQTDGILGILVYAMTYALFFYFFDGIIFHADRKQPLSIGILGSGVFLSFWGYRSLFSLVSYIYPVLMLLLALQLIKLFKRNENNVYRT